MNLELKKIIDESLVPRLEAKGKILAVGIASNGSETRTSLTFQLDVYNLGMPSIVTEYQLQIHLPNKEVFLDIPVHIEGTITLGDVSGRGGMQISSQDFIYNKTIAPIPTGAMATGFLIFFIPFKNEEVNIEGTKAEILFKDIKGKSYYTEEINSFPLINPTAEEVAYYPGVEIKRIMPKPETPIESKKTIQQRKSRHRKK